MKYYKIKDEYLHLWGDDISPNLLTMEEVQDICRGWGCDVVDIFYQLEVVYYE